MLKGVLKPKWQHPDAEVRRRAVEQLSSSEREILEQVAREDEAAAVRRLALRRCTDLGLLAERAADDPEASVREQAEKRYRQLLTGRASDAPPLALRLKTLAASEHQALLEHVAREGQEIELRELALQKVERVPVLRDIALNDAEITLRLRALERIDDESILAQIHQRSRKRDKRVSRRAREKLDALIAVRERPQRAQCLEICRAAERLGRYGHWERDSALLAELEPQWQQIAQEERAPHEQRFRDARQAFRDALETHRRAELAIRSTREALIEGLEALLREPPEEPIPGENLPAALESRIHEARAAWDRLPVVADTREQVLETRFQSARNAVLAKGRTLRREADLRALCEASEKLLTRKGFISEREVKSLERRRQATDPTPRESGNPETIDRRLDGTLGTLRDRLREQLKRKEATLETLPQRLDELKAAVKDGDASRARPLHDAIEADLDTLVAMGTSKQRLGALPSRFKALTREVGVMKAWDQFGARQVRERLCEAMEALIGAEEPPEAIAHRIREARAEWKRLGARDPDANQALWRRFDEAARKAYEPSQAHFEQRATARKANLTKRRILAERLDTFLATADWSTMDWKTAVRFRREMLADWQRASPVDRKPGEALERRWRTALRVMEAHLDAERQRSLRTRERLIEQATALIDSLDPRQAAEECKSLQQHWTTTVPASRGREKELWNRFRTACDAVFERRRKIVDEVRDRAQANLELRQALCQRAEALAAASPEGIGEAVQEMHRIQGEWQQLGAVPRRDGASIEKRFAKALQGLHDRRETLAVEAQRADLEMLERKAVLCHEAEAMVGSGAPTETDMLEALHGRWRALGALADPQHEQTIRERFERACQGFRDAAAEAASQEARQCLCLRMEILAGIDSPPEHTQARMAFQVERLATALSGQQASEDDSLGSLVRAWCLTGPAPTNEAEALEQRFSRAREACSERAG